MKAPGFWQTGGGLTTLLSPFEIITRTLTAQRLAWPGFAAAIPVICAGNASVGGAGKTILAIDLLRRLPGRPFALTRGYGGRLQGPLRVELGRHKAADVGDEALLLAAVAPTIVSRDRAAGAKLAMTQGATAIVMDDGLQNPGLQKTASFLVIDGGQGFGNGHLLPAGPLREPIAAAAARCIAAVLIGPDECNALLLLPPGLPILRATLKPSCATLSPSTPVLAFAGIGRPEKFFASAKTLGLNIRETIAFPDHHAYTAQDETRLAGAAAAQNAALITTAKDAVKLSPAFRAQCHVVTVSLSWADEPAFTQQLQKITAPRSEMPRPPAGAEPRSSPE
jgi:tetraacyldisaccharide 4'-kinase